MMFLSDNIIGTNLFTYCYNNPVNYADHTGYYGTPLQWLCAFIGGYVGWCIGDWVARKMGLFDGKWWQWQTASYWAVRGLVVAGGAILGQVAGKALLGYLKSYLAANASVLAKMPGPIQSFIYWFLGMGGTKAANMMTELFNACKNHIFSKQHIADGIRKLGGTDRQIFDKIMKVINSKTSQMVTGSNQIHTTINGHKVTIRFWVQNGVIKNIDAFIGHATRIIGKLLK